MRWHISSSLPRCAWLSPAASDGLRPPRFEAAGLDFAPVPPRYHTPYFSHIFSGGYGAGYYAYIWSDVLARDTES